ncbi:MAG: hypothetical protein OEW21_07445, partial [Betaproteobacteria bacterium]|nr:hypothetical protein [Betaproteobacteria bacterium]
PLAVYTPGPATLLDELWTRVGTTNEYTRVVSQQPTAATNTSNLSNIGNLAVIAATDQNGDGKYDYQGTSFNTVSNNPQSASNTMTVALPRMTNTATLAQVANNLVTAGNGSGGNVWTFLDKASPLRMFFNMPVVAQPATLRLTTFDSLKAITVAAPATTTDVAFTVSSGSGGSELVVTPAAALAEQNQYQLNGSVQTAAGAGADTVTQIPQANWVVHGTTAQPTGQVLLGAATAPTIYADNFDYCTGGAAYDAANTAVGTCPAAGTVMLSFPEMVWGTVQLQTRTIGTVNTQFTGNPVNLNGQFLCYNAPYGNLHPDRALHLAQGGCAGSSHAGIVYRYNTGQFMTDHTAGNPQQLKLAFDIYDSNGNSYIGVQTLNVD